MANNFPNLRPSFSADFVNGIYVDPRITFSRAGGRTFFGREMVKAEENLFLRSREFDNAYWTKTRTTVTANTEVAPDGTTTADTVLETADTNTHVVFNTPVTVAAGTYTMSVSVKANGRDWVGVGWEVSGSGTAVTYFDLSNGTVGTNAAGNTASIVNEGSGWYRCSVTRATGGSGGLAYINIFTASADNTNNYAGDITKGLFIWEAKLEQRGFLVPAVVTTTTQPITRYQRQLKTAAANEWPREFDPVTGECLGRSVWESRTNLLLRSEEFDNAYWGKANATILANQIIAPDGTLTADKLIMDAGIGPNTAAVDGLVRFDTVASNVYTYSIFAKAGEFTSLRVRENTVTGNFIEFNLLTGVAPAASAQFVTPKMENAGNGWYRCSWTSPAGMTAINRYNIRVGGTGDGTSGIYIWGAQLE